MCAELNGRPGRSLEGLEGSRAGEQCGLLRSSSKGLEGNNFSNWTRNRSCDVLAKTVALCPCPKNLLESKLKINGPISLVEEILRQPNVESVV